MSKTVIRHLGSVSTYGMKYDKTLLDRVSRADNRDAHNINKTSCPFVGYDTWVGFEATALTDTGCPVNGIAKVVYSADSEFMVESKSIKLYFNSMNMHKMGASADEVRKNMAVTGSKDLSEILQVKVDVHVASPEEYNNKHGIRYFDDYYVMENMTNLDREVVFDKYTEDPSLIKISHINRDATVLKLASSLLRSNCKITNQADAGDVFIYAKSAKSPIISSILQYIVSFREHQDFHESCCEMIYKRLWDAMGPDELAVTCLYTRRGGWHISPTRASHEHLLDKRLITASSPDPKTARQ